MDYWKVKAEKVSILGEKEKPKNPKMDDDVAMPVPRHVVGVASSEKMNLPRQAGIFQFPVINNNCFDCYADV